MIFWWTNGSEIAKFIRNNNQFPNKEKLRWTNATSDLLLMSPNIMLAEPKFNHKVLYLAQYEAVEDRQNVHQIKGQFSFYS